jgi:hypothetical protein
VSWDVISKLIEEATGMSGDEVVDKIRVERGAEWIRLFQREHPIAALFLDRFIKGSPDEALSALAVWKPDIAQLKYARLYIEKLQGVLRSKR